MREQRSSCCGTICTECEYYPNECAGCQAVQGKVFWLGFTGEDVCGIYDCCIHQKKLLHCGLCKALPCKRYELSEPTKSEAENQANLERQLFRLHNTPPLVWEEGEIRLEQAAELHRAAAEEMKQEFFQHGEATINGSALFDQLDFDEWLKRANRNHHPETVQTDWAVATTFFAVRKTDGKMLGMLDLRHSLDTPFLKEYGGHIGYAVRPTQRRKGYAVQMLQTALAGCARMGISPVVLGCYADNIASVRTIETCSGVLVEEKPYLDGKLMHCYSIRV